MTEWTTKKLTDFLDDEEIEDIRMIMTNNDWDLLRKYLNDRKEKLEKKGVLADYLYYFLMNEFRGGS